MTLDLFSKQADTYAVSRPQYPEQWYKFLFAQCAGNSLVWEAACGNGQATVALSKYFNRVVATDLSPQQIDNALSLTNVSYSVSAAENISLADNSCDLVCTAQALHWFDLPQYWQTVSRVLKPGGVFATWGYNWNSFDAELDECIHEAVFKPIESYWAPNNKLLWDRYRDIDFPFEAIEVPEVAMPAEYNLYELFNLYRSMSGVQIYIQQHGDEYLRRAFENVKSVWGDPEIKKMSYWDIVSYCGRLRHQ
jgi:SAM-dependent methyltransferase